MMSSPIQGLSQLWAPLYHAPLNLGHKERLGLTPNDVLAYHTIPLTILGSTVPAPLNLGLNEGIVLTPSYKPLSILTWTPNLGST